MSVMKRLLDEWCITKEEWDGMKVEDRAFCLALNQNQYLDDLIAKVAVQGKAPVPTRQILISPTAQSRRRPQRIHYSAASVYAPTTPETVETKHMVGGTMIPEDKLDLWIKNNYNVLLIGKHGVGKTSIAMAAFKRNKLKAKYYSASTMDPFVDFIGIPKDHIDESGQHVIEYVRPADIAHDEVEIMMFDEFNRAHKKIRNAVMELMQFKSINGVPMRNLRAVWAAINPEDNYNTYDVERLDPAQRDRFHIIYHVNYQLDKAYFVNKFSPAVYDKANKWWSNLGTQNKEILDQVSPRRLDYALEAFSNGIDLSDVLPSESNPQALVKALNASSDIQAIEDLFSNKDINGLVEYVKSIEPSSLAPTIQSLNEAVAVWTLINGVPSEVWPSLLNSPKVMTKFRRGLYFKTHRTKLDPLTLQLADEQWANIKKRTQSPAPNSSGIKEDEDAL